MILHSFLLSFEEVDPVPALRDQESMVIVHREFIMKSLFRSIPAISW
jgi:hypothetical protein